MTRLGASAATISLALAIALAAGACTNVDDETSSGAGPFTGGGGAIEITVSGEALAYTGYRFPPASGDVGFVDGWELAFDEVLVTVDDVTLSANPDTSPTDPSRTGPVVARLPGGPWALDLHARGDLAGKGGGGETALRIGELTTENQAGGGRFDPESRYAFGFRTVAATGAATMTNLSDAARADYQEMIAKGYTTLFVGTATFKGSSCTTSDDSYDFDALPKVVKFRFGFATPAAYVNCQNPDDDPARPFEGEEHERGVQVKPNQPVVAQVTLHTDHLFWDALTHDAPLHFDMIAARYAGAPAGADPPIARVEDFAGAPFAPFRDARGAVVARRSCVGAERYVLPRGPLAFDARGVPVASYSDFMIYAERTLGHLNADGLCFVAPATR